MKKKLTTLLLTGTLLLNGCFFSELVPKTTEAEDSTQETTAEAITEDTGYADLERYQSKSFVQAVFSWKNSDQALTMDLPIEWELSKTGNGQFAIYRDENLIGTLSLGEATDLSEWNVLKTTKETTGRIAVKQYLEKRAEGEATYRFRNVYSIKEENQIVTLTADYTEVADFTNRKLLSSLSLTPLRTDASFGVLSNCQKESILILGNSFINSSKVGAILQEMLGNNGKSANVTHISRGYATVKTYIEDSNMMSRIRGGSYDIVFICGFYSSGEVQNLNTLKAACKASGTTLVIFPAHNENAGVVSSACSANSDLLCLDWKSEINALIKNGVDQWDFCINDQHKHSTPLAGYVGAHMIYRALYNAVPKGNVYSYINQAEVNSLLGDYVKTGALDLIDPDRILSFN